MRTAIESLIALSFVSWAQAVIAEDVSIETVLTGLSRPSSVAVRPGGTPERYEVFVAESGSRRIIRMLSNEPNRALDAITGFPEDAVGGYGAPADSLGGILFLDEKHLVVSVAGAPPELRVYELTETGTSISANQAKQQVTPEQRAENPEAALGMYEGLARTRANDYVADILFVTNRYGGPVRGAWKVPIRSNMLGTITHFEIKAGLQVIQPTTLAVSEQGYVIAFDASDHAGRIRLMFLNPMNGQVVLNFSNDLSGIGDMAYSPKSGNLYMAAGALFRIDDASKPGEQLIALTKLADIEGAKALAFGPDGALYVTTFDGDAYQERGDANKGRGDANKERGGALLKVTGVL